MERYYDKIKWQKWISQLVWKVQIFMATTQTLKRSDQYLPWYKISRWTTKLFISNEKIVVHGQEYSVGPTYCIFESQPQITAPAFDWTRPGWCGGEEEVAEQMKMTASCPLTLPDGRLMRHFFLETTVSIRHLPLNWSAREDTSLSSHTRVFTTNKAEQMKVSQKFALLQWTCQASPAKLHE